jgi:hypothetical protein
MADSHHHVVSLGGDGEIGRFGFADEVAMGRVVIPRAISDGAAFEPEQAGPFVGSWPRDTRESLDFGMLLLGTRNVGSYNPPPFGHVSALMVDLSGILGRSPTRAEHGPISRRPEGRGSSGGI